MFGFQRSRQAVLGDEASDRHAAAREHWQDRVAELERKAREKAEEKTLESIDEMTQRHLKYLKVLPGKALEALEALRTMPLKTAMDAVRISTLASARSVWSEV